MLKTILVGASGGSSDSAALTAALAIARAFGAHLEVLHVRVDAAAAAVAMTTDGGTGAITAGLIERLEGDAREREAKARAGFDTFCAANAVWLATAAGGEGVSAEWHVETGEEPRWMAEYGRTADLVVAPRAEGDEETPRTVLETVMFETGRPVLIPSGAMPAAIDRIAIAWKPTREAARAVALALPLLQRAKEALVVTVEESPEPSDAAERLAHNLAWHGLAARTERLQPTGEGAAATLLSGITGRADLLVMGGYGHGRLREWVFGGFTQQMLAAAPLPVLIAH